MAVRLVLSATREILQPRGDVVFFAVGPLSHSLANIHRMEEAMAGCSGNKALVLLQYVNADGVSMHYQLTHSHNFCVACSFRVTAEGERSAQYQ